MNNTAEQTTLDILSDLRIGIADSLLCNSICLSQSDIVALVDLNKDSDESDNDYLARVCSTIEPIRNLMNAL